MMPLHSFLSVFEIFRHSRCISEMLAGRAFLPVVTHRIRYRRILWTTAVYLCCINDIRLVPCVFAMHNRVYTVCRKKRNQNICSVFSVNCL